MKPSEAGTKRLPSQAELAQLACLLDKGGKLPPEDLVSRAFVIWGEADKLLRLESKGALLIESEAGERWLDNWADRKLSVKDIANRGLLPSHQTKTGRLKSEKRVKQVLSAYREHLVLAVKNMPPDSEESLRTGTTLVEIARALKNGKIQNHTLQLIKAHLEQQQATTVEKRADGKSLPPSSVPECRDTKKLLEAMTTLTERDNAKGRVAPKR